MGSDIQTSVGLIMLLEEVCNNTFPGDVLLLYTLQRLKHLQDFLHFHTYYIHCFLYELVVLTFTGSICYIDCVWCWIISRSHDHNRFLPVLESQYLSYRSLALYLYEVLHAYIWSIACIYYLGLFLLFFSFILVLTELKVRPFKRRTWHNKKWLKE